MNHRLALRRLWWKELRQLAPLVIMLPVLVVLLLSLQRLVMPSNQTLAWATFLLCFGMPGIFACGAGALLVGYEKELRTINWLSSLPIAPQRIIRVKLGAATVSLLVLWGLGLTIFAVAAGGNRRFVMQESPDPWPWIFNSLFVLLAGFALAWTMRSAFVSLLLIVPIAILPYLAAYGIDNGIRQVSGDPNPSTDTLLVCQCVGIALAAWLAERTGRRGLGPRSTERPFARWFSLLRRERSGVSPLTRAVVQSPVAALVWQFARQNRAVLLGTSLMMACVMALLAVVEGRGAFRDNIPAAGFLAFLATAWLGVSVFQSDAHRQRIRFLADRGISPRLIWLTRHIVPASLLAIWTLSVGLVVVFAMKVERHQLDEVSVVLGLGLLGAVVVYLAAQWLGQVVFSPIISAITVPFVAWGVLAYGVFVFKLLGMPYWYALVVVPIPAIATWRMTRRWMDRRLGLSYWASHAGFLVAFALLPFVPVLVAVYSQPTMPREIAREIQQFVQKPHTPAEPPVSLIMGQQKLLDHEAVSSEQRAVQAFAFIEAQLQETSAPIGSSPDVLDFLRTTATLARLRLDAPQHGQELAPAEDETTLHVYRRACELLLEITRCMRDSFRLVEQDTADRVEIWLLSEMLCDGARERLGEPLYKSAAAMLKDRRARREARLRAVALSWQIFHDDETSRHLGGYDWYAQQQNLGTLKGRWIAERRVGRAVSDLWVLARDGADAATEERLGRIAAFWGHSLERYGIGSQGPYLRADDLDRFVQTSFMGMRAVIANQWGADWERLAAQRFSEE